MWYNDKLKIKIHANAKALNKNERIQHEQLHQIVKCIRAYKRPKWPKARVYITKGTMRIETVSSRF